MAEQQLYFISNNGSLVDEGAKISFFFFLCQTRYVWETLIVRVNCFFLSRASWIQWRSPSLGVSGREASWDQVWVVCCVFQSFVRPSFPPSRLYSSLSFCPSLSPSLSLSALRFHFPLISCLHPSNLLAFHLPSSLSRYLNTVVSFFVPAIFRSLHASFPLSLGPFLSLRSCLALFLLFSLP